MWVLECDGNVLDGKRKWLRPGKAYTIGRKATIETVIGVGHKSVSAKHLRITVDVPARGDASKLLKGSKVKIEDLESKIGTVLDGVKIKGETRTISGERHMFNLGSYPHAFWIKWEPVVLSVSFPPKELNSGKDVLAGLREQIESAGIKAVTEFIVGKTTHVVSNARNTTLGLEGLINAKPMVSLDFVSVLVDMCRPRSSSDPDGVCKLELDFDAYFPRAEDYLPAQSRDQDSDPSLFRPDPKRASIFHGMTFVFLDIKQYNRMLGVITNGEGKSEHYPLKTHETDPKAFAEHIRAISGGSKSRRSLIPGNKKIIIVRVKPKGTDTLVWMNWFLDVAQKELNRRFVDPKDFLPVILSGDANTFPTELGQESLGEDSIEDSAPKATPAPKARRRISIDEVQVPSSQLEETSGAIVIEDSPIRPRSTVNDSHPDNLQHEPIHNPPSPPEARVEQDEAAAPPSRSRRPRRMITSQFTGFDDGFNPASYTNTQLMQSQSNGHQRSQIDDDEDSLFLHSQDSEPAPRRPQRGKKRDLDVVAEEDEEIPEIPNSEDEAETSQVMLDNLLPAAREMKKRKLEKEKEDAANREVTPVAISDNEAVPVSKGPSPRRGKKFLSNDDQEMHDHVVQQAQKRRAAIDSKLDKEREDMMAGIDELRLEKPAEVLAYQVKPRNRAGLRANGAHAVTSNGHDAATDLKGKAAMYGPNGVRWDPAWNGRKNFKRFRPQKGVLEGNQRRLHSRIIVPLVEAERRNYGLQDPEWLARIEEKRRERQRRLRDLPGEGPVDSFENGSSSGRGSGRPIEEELRAEDERAQRDADAADRIVDGRPRREIGDSGEPPGGSAGTVGRTQNGTGPSLGSKRPAASGSSGTSAAASAAAAKRQKTLRGKGKTMAVVDDSESSDGELTFRMVRRGG